MAQKAPQAPMNRRTTYQGAGARSTGRGSVVTSGGGGSTVTINPGAQKKTTTLPAAQKKPAATAPAPQRPRYRLNPPSSRPRRQVTPRQVARGTRRAVTGVTQRKTSLGSKHTLTVELIIGLIIVLIRVVADYEPQHDGTVKGKIGHPKGQYGPLPVAAGLIGVFFVLSFFTAKGGAWAKAANGFGALVVLALGLNSADEVRKVAATFPNWGKGIKPAGSWESTGTAAGQPVTGSSGGGSGGSGQAPANPPRTLPKPHNGTCPPGYGYDKALGRCLPLEQKNPVS